MIHANDIPLFQFIFKQGECFLVPIRGCEYGHAFIVTIAVTIVIIGLMMMHTINTAITVVVVVTQEFAHGCNEIGNGFDEVCHIAGYENVCIG